jgi:pimeloyl-ACP methyl ester carboxylesterase
LRQLWAAARYRAPAQAPAPTLILASRNDALVDPSCSEELARRWRVPVRMHASAGHDLTLDDPDWVVDQIRGWVAQADLRSAGAALNESGRR